MASSSPSPSDAQILPRSEVESQLSSVVYDLSQQVQEAMGNMLNMIKEVDQNSTEIMEEIEKCKDSAIERKKTLQEEKDRFQKAAYTVLDMLNNEEIR